MLPAPLATAGRLVLFALLWFPAVLPAAQSDYLSSDEAFNLATVERVEGRVELTWEIASGYYLYRHAFAAEGVDGVAGGITYPDGRQTTDEYFGEQEVYYDSVTLRVDPGQARRLAVTWQGCAEDGLCYQPQETTVDVPQDGSGSVAAVEGSSGAIAGDAALGEDQQLALQLSQWSAAWVVAAFFGMGLLLVFTPCVLPMLPILSSLIVGANAGPQRSFMLSVAYVLPMAVTYAAVGIGAGLAGASLQAALQSPWVLIPFALVFVLLALAMFGLFDIQLPGALRQRLDSAQRGRRGGTLGGAAVMGGLSALLVGPCMTAPLAGALLYIADTGNAATGGLALLALGLGMGAPLVVIGTFGVRILPKPGIWMNRVKVAFGFLLLGMAVWFLDRIAPAPVILALWGIWLLAVAVALWQVTRGAEGERSSTVAASVRVGALAGGIWAAALLLGAAAGNADPWQPLTGLIAADGEPAAASGEFMSRFEPVASDRELEREIAAAAKRGQWTIVDFYADWCVSCEVIEDEVFGDSAVQQALAGARLLRPDLTANDETDRRLMAAHDILGPPTIMIVGPDGVERRQQRVIGEISAGAFLERLETAKENG